MAKKKEQVAPETMEAPQETATPGTAEVPQERVTPETVEEPRETETPSPRDITEIMSDKVETAEKNTDTEEASSGSRPEEKGQPEEKVLFYIRTVNSRTAIRSAPEYPMRGDNIVGTIDDKELYGIVEVVDGFGRLAGGSGWIMIDPGVVICQG